ncbi:flippase [Candidatus Uhrbacteria bacterium]|nr:flippase [Candidatus Uhrbacteria bacterium]
MSETRILAWNTGVQAVGKLLSTALGVIMIALMTRRLGQDGFGIYTSAIAYFQVFALLLDLGINVMLVQMLGEHRGDAKAEDRIVSATFTLRLVSSLVILTAAPLIGLLLNYPWELKLTLFAIWGSFISTALNQIVVGVQQRHLKMQMVAISEIAGRIIMVAGVALAVYLGWGLVPIVFLISIGGLANFAINFWFAHHLACFGWNWDPIFWRSLLRRAWPIGISIIFNLIYYRADTLVLSFVRPMSEVGVYGASYRVLEILITFPFMYAGILLPLLAHSWASGDKKHFANLIRNSFVSMILLAAPIVAGTLVIGTQIMTLVAGPEFAVSGPILKILILAVGAIFLGTVSSHAIVALDAQRKTMPLYIAVAIAALAGYLIFIPTYGIFAAAWLTVFSEAVIALGTTLISLKLSGISLPWWPMAKCLVASMIMALAILPLADMWLPIPILVGAAIYFALVVAFGAVSKSTIKELLSFRRMPSPPDVF